MSAGAWNHTGYEPTLWEQATVSIGQMLAKVPAISELVVALEQFYAIAFR